MAAVGGDEGNEAGVTANRDARPGSRHRTLGFLRRHRLLTFVLMCLSFVIFGVMTVNLFFVFKANLEFLLAHGMMALMAGGLRQFIELVLACMVAMGFYVLFKVCEKILVDRFTQD